MLGSVRGGCGCGRLVGGPGVEDRAALPARDLHPGNVDLAPQAPLNFLVGSCLEEQGQRLLEVLPGLGDGVSLAGDIHLRRSG